ncbi:uncharacterized RNA-binding protein C365.04c-like isoform X2 [Lingula anatina]|uniref:Uncharacterized RNA-binding protein C365.04c-like isoform X2 n=1 Tax=Lingula anatina TaxID=7574 RepID=A0A1S3I6Y9_LINAN|nr:uncharacterized RNA-binding protein C365.04c-like isoform X2 [Lingula anatina]|eukprot:XP_013393611.1 uncharacterized RNA-binding protein C365.04c-like isoform X2 [Lingula anatina]
MATQHATGKMAAPMEQKTGKSSRIEKRRKWWGKHKNMQNGDVNTVKPATNKTKSAKKQKLLTREDFTQNKQGFKKTFRTSHAMSLDKQTKREHSDSSDGESVQKVKGEKEHSDSSEAECVPKLNSDQTEICQETKTGSLLVSPSKKGHKKNKKQPELKTQKGKKSTVERKRKYVLFVGHLPEDISKEDILEHFKSSGKVLTIRLPTHKETGKQKGFAFVEFGDEPSLRRGLQLHRSELLGSKINVEFTSVGGKNQNRLEKLKKKNLRLAKYKMRYALDT